ncbi:FAD-dependent monooxygenase [Piscinibacter terrae]|uniref:2,4-dichlorophenol 6-monooxygenase n=1 Tax=Piscinibacter terrae TaxID=2496871 RepID=A0A3N7HKM5_9BURK|nr:FAD-dependent monooxygenase [Albitalea terrae]RQP22640.1 2,4-dichlorophenol 6-monooxygenase [Albitalea terrae]
MQHTQVLVVGGSLVGLSAALFLAARGVNAITVERHAGSSPHPRAIGYTPRTIELFRAVGLGDAIPQAPQGFRLRRARVTSLCAALQSEHDWTPPAKADRAPTRPVSPVRGAAIAQDRLEPILRGRAIELGADIRPFTELVSFQQDAEGVTAVIRSRETGSETTIRARYMIAADGGDSRIREALNITRSGRGHMRFVRSVLFRADLDEHLQGGISQWEIEQPGQPGLKAFLTTYQDGRWVLMFTDDVERNADEQVAAIRRAVGREDLDVDVLATGRWDLSALVADRFSSGRIFLAGDAAHQLPPTRGGYGANTGIHDVHNLAWKLQAVLSGTSSPALLDTYDAERRPIAWTRHQQTFARPDYAADAPKGMKSERIIGDDAIEFGQLHRSTAVLGAGSELPEARHPDEWNGQPGTRAPHCPIHVNGTAASFIDLLQRGWLLVAMDSHWSSALKACAAAIDIAIVGADFSVDEDTDLASLLGIGAQGAVLIRPDGIIAWRGIARGSMAELADAFAKVASLASRKSEVARQ